MSATAIWDVSVLPSESSAIEPLLDLALSQAYAEGAYVYRFNREQASATLAAFVGPANHHTGQFRVGETRGRIAAFDWNRKTPVVLRANAGLDWRFSGFPEFRDGRFQGVVSAPLLDCGEVVGVANFCRSGDAPLSANALTFLMSLSLPLGALLGAAALREQLQKANQDLADRKVVERAKGLVQARLECTEEEAYLRMRRLSRQRRTPLREIARKVIQSGADSLLEALEQQYE
jgi:two-component system, response regulator PdtaR